MPVGTLAPENCGPSFPPNNPAQDLVDFRYPFLVISSSEILPGKPASAVDKKLKRLKIRKTVTVKFQTTLEPAKTLLFDGSGYSYEGAMGVFWTLKLKRLS